MFSNLGETTAGQVSTTTKSLLEVIKDWFNHGDYKVAATARAEDFSKRFYELADGSVREGVPIEAHGRLFSPTSVAGMVERCQLEVAGKTVSLLEQQIRDLAARDQYFAAWAREWGFNDIANLRSAIERAKTQCSSSIWGNIPDFILQGAGIPPPGSTPGTNPCGPGLVYREGFCVSAVPTIPPVNTMGTISKEMLIVGGLLFGGIAVFSMAGGSRKRS